MKTCYTRSENSCGAACAVPPHSRGYRALFCAVQDRGFPHLRGKRHKDAARSIGRSCGHGNLIANVIREDEQPGTPHSPPLDQAPFELSPVAPPTDKATAELTPFMRQWTAAKRENPDALLFFRMGDFYELFYDDAVTVSRELQLTLTARDRERSQPMCGVPYHAVEGYLTRLLRKGYRIAICDQMEDPKLTKKIVRREVTRVLTPGTALDAALGQEQNNFLAALYEAGPGRFPKRTPSGAKAPGDLAPFHVGAKAPAHQSGQDARTSAPAADKGQPLCAVALLDVSTGEFRTAEFQGPAARQQAVDEILMANPSEVLLAASAELPAPLERIPARTRIEDWVWTRDFAVPLVERQLNVRSLEGFGLVGHRAGGDCGRSGAALCAHHAEERGAAHRQPQVSGALDGARTGPGDGAQSRTGRAALSSARTTGPRSFTPWTRARRRWASGCCGPRFCARSSMPRRSRPAMRRWPRRTATC